MSKHNDKYTLEGDDDSQVRTIIRRLNEDRPAQEKSREVVVRADGTKAIRVTKKRKMMMTNEERNRRSRRSFVMILLGGILLCTLFVAFFMYRMTSMTGTDYLTKQEAALTQAWGAKQVRCSGASIDGMELSIASIVAEFPENAFLQRAELTNVKASLSASTFLSGKIKADELSIARASLIVSAAARQLDMPRQTGEDLWKIKRVVCDDLNVTFGGVVEADSPVVLRQSQAYMYGPTGARVVMLNGGLLMMRGWKPISLTEGKMRMTPTSIEDISLRGTTDPSRRKADGRPETTVHISGAIAGGSSLAGPLMLDADNMNFAEFSNGAFAHFFAAHTEAIAKGSQKPLAFITLPIETTMPRFSGVFHVKDVRITAFPAMMIFTEHIDPKYRKRYLPPMISKGSVTLSETDGNISLVIAENDMEERDLISLRAKLTVDAANQLSGTVDYGLPAILTRVEYPDGLSDPMFREDGRNAWFCTQVSGAANQPTDNAEQLDVAAEDARKLRPARTPFDTLDVERLNQRINAANADAQPQPEQTPAPMNQQNPFGADTQPQQQQTTFPDAPSTLPTGGGLTLPVDNSIFGGGL